MSQPERNLTGQPARRSNETVLERIQSSQDFDGVRVQGLCSSIRLHATSAPYEQIASEAAFQVFEVEADRGLRKTPANTAHQKHALADFRAECRKLIETRRPCNHDFHLALDTEVRRLPQSVDALLDFR